MDLRKIAYWVTIGMATLNVLGSVLFLSTHHITMTLVCLASALFLVMWAIFIIRKDE